MSKQTEDRPILPTTGPLALKKRTTRRPKPTPKRTCIGCIQVRAKREMVRIVRTPEGKVEVDPTGKRSGRGTYICYRRACWDAALREGRLAHALETEISELDRQALEQYALSLPEESATPEQIRDG